MLAAALSLAWLAWTAGPGLVDADSLYHARAAWLLADRGPVRAFPWMSATFLAERFADKELLFHALLAPFCASEANLDGGAKIATVLLGTAVFAATGWAGGAARGRLGGLAVLLLLASGHHFLVRLAMTRPHVLSIVLVVVGTRLVVERRRRALAVVGFVHAWSYAAPHLLAALALAASLARRPRDGRLDLATPLAALGGAALGLLVHPQSPYTLELFFVQNVLVPLQAWGASPFGAALPLGREFESIDARSLLLTSTGVLVALGATLLALVATERRPSSRTAALAGMALAAFGLQLLAARFVEYAAPLAALLAASALDDAIARDAWPASRRAGAAAIAALVVLGALHTRALRDAGGLVATLPPPALHGAARWLRANAPPGCVVAHLSWEDFATLFHDDPDHRYLVGLDPVFLAATDADAALCLEAMRQGTRELDPAWLARRFGARYLAVRRARGAGAGAALVAGLAVAYEDAGAFVFELPAPFDSAPPGPRPG